MDAAIAHLNDAVYVIAPEVILLATMCVMFLLGPFLVDEASRGQSGLSRRWTALSVIALAIGGWALVRGDLPAGDGGPFVADGLSYYVRLLTFTLGPLLVLVLTRQIDDGASAEAHGCLLAILAGANLVSLATDLVGMFLALELVSIPTYAFLYLPRRDAAMQEATLKYFMLSIFSSALVLMGLAWLFGAAGSTNFAEIAARLGSESAADAAPLVQGSLALLIAGFSFRIAAVPFHFYAPDVFQGVSSASAAMLSVVPKVVGFTALVRVLSVTGVLGAVQEQLAATPIQQLLAVLAVATMTLGNLLALRQRHLQRLLAFSSVAHAGYMLTGLAIGPSEAAVGGVTALWFYLGIYGLTTIGVFALFSAADVERPLENDEDLKGLSQVHPTIALLLAVCLFGLAGLPPTAGFNGKLSLFIANWSSTSPWGMWLAVAIAANAAIGAYYYLRLIALMYRDVGGELPARPLNYGAAVAGGICAVGSIILFGMPQQLLDLAAQVAP
jgi:NADH-quinone oxidoreductase subunit N